MKDKAYEITIIILSIIAVLMVIGTLFLLSQHQKVDCERLLEQRNSIDYMPLPKQCEKGE